MGDKGQVHKLVPIPVACCSVILNAHFGDSNFEGLSPSPEKTVIRRAFLGTLKVYTADYRLFRTKQIIYQANVICTIEYGVCPVSK